MVGLAPLDHTLRRRDISHDGTSWLALDIGGANLKAAHTSGATRSLPFALWKQPERLADALRCLGRPCPRRIAWP